MRTFAAVMMGVGVPVAWGPAILAYLPAEGALTWCQVLVLVSSAAAMFAVALVGVAVGSKGGAA